MTKTNKTLFVEKSLFNHFNKPGTYCCLEVKVGTLSSQKLVTDNTELVDLMVYHTDGTIRCIEIKTSLSDFKSQASLSFYGDYNYIAISDNLLEPLMQDNLLKPHFWNGIGLMLIDKNGNITIHRKPKKKQIGLGLRNILAESMLRSLSKDANKHYINYYKEIKNE